MSIQKTIFGIVVIASSSMFSSQMLQEEAKDSLQHLLRVSALLENRRVTQLNVLMQAKVLNQFTAQGSSPASCGYHSLRNGLLIARAGRSALVEHLELINSVDSMAGTLSKWRLYINMRRLKKKTFDYVVPLLMTYL